MVIQSKTYIKIGNKDISDYKSLEIIQKVGDHHKIEIVVWLRNLESESSKFAFESKRFLGQKVKVKINTTAFEDSDSGFEFMGIVTEIKNRKGTEDYSKDEVVIVAMSPTIKLDDGPNYNSYSEMSITELVDKTILAYGDGNIDFDVIPMDDSYITYSVQSNESAFDYLCRLAKQYGEWFFYDGLQVLFGRPVDTEVTLRRTVDLKSFDISLQPKSQKYQYFNHDYHTDKTLQELTSDYGSESSEYNDFASEKAGEIYNSETKVWNNIGDGKKIAERLESNIVKQKAALVASQLKLTGVSDNPGIKLGGIIVIERQKYRVVEISHFDSKDGIYENKFVAVSAETDAYPYTDIDSYPESQPQTAIVIDNEDVDELGRVKVKFPWQMGKDSSTPWIRVVTAHGGANKGFQFIPEIGEEVLIGFEGGNAERPFMMESLYNGNANASEWVTPKNDIKAIRTRSGHTIEFCDAKGEESITIEDLNGNKVLIDTANNNMEITALETMVLNAKNIDINAQENIRVNAGLDMLTNVSENYDISAKNSSKIIEDYSLTDSKKNEILADEIRIVSDKEDLILNSGKSVDVQSEEKVKLY